MKEFKKILSEVEQDNQSGSGTLADKILTELIAIAPELTPEEKNKVISDLTDFINRKPYFESIQHLLRTLQSRDNWIEALKLYFSHNRESLLNIAKQFKSMVGNSTKTFLLHSNSQTVVSAFRGLNSSTSKIKIYQTESVPGKEGLVQAELLKQIGFPVTLVEDDPSISILEQVDWLVSGADVVLSTEFINKVGTRLLASKMLALRKSFIVMADHRKFNSTKPKLISPQFELIPRNLITHLITD